MTSPGGQAYSAGTIFLQVVPSFRNFQKQVRQASKDAERAFAAGMADGAEIEKALDKALDKGRKGAVEKGSLLGKELSKGVHKSLDKTFANLTNTLKLTVNDEEVNDKLTGILARLEAIKRDVGVEIDIDGAREVNGELDDIKRDMQEIRDYGQLDVKVRSSLDEGIKDIRRELGEVERAAEKASKSASLNGENQKRLQRSMLSTLAGIAPLKLKIDASAAEREAIAIGEKIEALLRSTVDVEMDDAALARVQSEVRDLYTDLVKLDSKDASVEVKAITAKAKTELAALGAQASRLDRTRVKIETRVEGAAQASQALRGFNAMVLLVAAGGPALVPILGAIAGGLLAIGPAALAAGAGLGVVALGFSGLAPAIKAMNTAAKDGAEQQRALDKTTRAAAKGVREAEQRVSDARQNGANASEDAARRVTEAQQDVADATKDASRAVRSALKDVERAEDELADAQRNSADAQRDLREARKAAADDLLDLESKVAKGALDERQALIDLFDAQVEYNALGGGATNLEREQATIALERARLALSDQRRENKALAAEQKEASKTGVEGVDRVVNARERAAEAQEKEKDAAGRVADAQEAVQTAREQGLERISNAQARLADAERAQARQAQDNARSMQNATEALTDAQANYRDTLMQTTASADELKDAMAGLTPVGQEFARFIFGLKDEFAALRGTAQAGLLPGVQRGIEALLPYGPQINSFVGTYAEAMGRMFESTLKGLTTEPWREFFGMLEERGPGMLDDWGQSFGNLGTFFASVMTTFAPLAESFASGLERMTRGWSEWAQSEKGQSQMRDFMAYVERVGPKVIEFFGDFFRGIGNLLKGLAPYGEMFLAALGAVFEFIAALPADVVGALVFALAAFVFTIQLMSGIFGALGVLATLVLNIAAAFGISVAAALGVVAVIAIVIIAFGILYAKVDWFRAGVNFIFNAIWETIKFLWYGVVKPIFDFIIGYLKVLWTVWSAIFDLIYGVIRFVGRGIADLYGKYVKPYVDAIAGYLKEKLGPAFSAIGEAAQSAWDGVKDIFKGGIRFVVDTVLNDGLINNFNKLADFFGSKTIPNIRLGNGFYDKENKRPEYKYATGGVVGGYSPTATADNIPAWLTAGEFVLPVNAVKRLRAMYGDEFLEGLRKGLPGFAQGGLVGFGRLLQARNFRVNEHPAFGGVRGRHSKNSLHYSGQAIDVNYGPGGENDIEKRAIDQIVGMAASYGLRTIWRTSGHFNHAHFDTGRSGNIMGKLGSAAGAGWGAIKSGAAWSADKVGEAVEWAKDGPIAWLKGKILGPVNTMKEKIGDSFLGQMLGGAAKRVGDNVLHAVQQLAGLSGDYVDDEPNKKPTLYDQGGWLPPGMTSIMNATGRPELILTPEQADAVLHGGGTYQITVPMMPTNSTPADVADAVLFAARRINRGGVYSGRG